MQAPHNERETLQKSKASKGLPFGLSTSGASLLAILALALAVATVLPLYAQGIIGAKASAITAVGAAVVFFVLLVCFYGAIIRLEGFTQAEEAPNGIYVRKVFIVSFFLIEAALLLALFSNYPGLCSPDSNVILDQVTGQSVYGEANRYEGLSNAHPVFYTFCIWLTFEATAFLGSEAASLFAFMFLQVTFVSFALAWSVAWLARMGANRGYVAAALCFAVFSPVIACHAIILWKDVPFAGVLLVLVLFLAGLGKAEKLSPRQAAALGILLLLVSLLRNNGYYVAVFTVVYLVIFRKGFRMQAAIVGLCLVAFMTVLQGPVFSALSISKGHFAESVGIPLQQLGATVAANGEIDDADKAVLDAILPFELWGELYDPSTSNPIKQHDEFNDEYLNTHKSEFLKAWLNCLPGNFTTYVKAWVLETYGYWQPGYTTYLGKLTCTADGVPATDLVGLSYQPQKIANGIRTLFPNVFGMGSLIWLSMIAMAFGIISGLTRDSRAKAPRDNRRQTHRHIVRAITPYVPLIGLIGTLLIAAPIVSDYRYILSLYLVLPFLPQIYVLCRS